MGAVSEQAKERKKGYDKSYYLRMSPEKKAEYNARDRVNRRNRKTFSTRETMLTDFLRAKTPHEKRQVITNFAPHYFIFGNTLDPRNPYDREKENEYETV